MNVSQSEVVTTVFVVLAWALLWYARSQGDVSATEFLIGAVVLAVITVGFLAGRVVERRSAR